MSLNVKCVHGGSNPVINRAKLCILLDNALCYPIIEDIR
jgi:hypothetical protein